MPSVVSVMVVHEPGDWFDETLRSLAAQDYSNLRTLFLVVARDDDEAAEITARIRAVIPTAFVRAVEANVGFGPAANEVLRLVEGDKGLFLVCHDDIALSRDAVRVLVEELFRSNAGIVGPKLTDWDEPRRLQHVGLGLDRFGEVDPVIDPGEHDQEQHDAVRDVFVLPSACMLVRADLFRALGGFDPAMSFHGEDVELCWRAHLTGARVIVAPDASVRHRERLTERRPDLHHRALRSRHRMRAVATLTGGSRLLGRSIQMVLLTLVELVIGLFTGRLGEALSSLRALVGLIPRTGSIISRRRAIRGQRVVHEREVLGLQDHGSSRLTSYLRGKETMTLVGADTTVKRWREASFGPLLAWFVVVLAIVIGSRTFIQESVPMVGEFLPFPDSPADLWGEYRGSFDGRSFGSTAALPTGWALLVVGSVLTLFRMSLLLTASIVGLYLLGALGAWRLCTVFPVNRARIAGMVVYVGVPLVPGLLSRGDWSALAWFAALPWMVHLLRRAAGIETADPDAAELDLSDGIVAVGIRHRLRALAFLSLAAGRDGGVRSGRRGAVGRSRAGARRRHADRRRLVEGRLMVGGIDRRVAGDRPRAEPALGARLGVERPDGCQSEPDRPVERCTKSPRCRRPPSGSPCWPSCSTCRSLAAVAITRAWRLTWSIRAAFLVIVFGALLVASERGSLDVALPRPIDARRSDRARSRRSAARRSRVGSGPMYSGAGSAGVSRSDCSPTQRSWSDSCRRCWRSATVRGTRRAPRCLACWPHSCPETRPSGTTECCTSAIRGVLPVPGREFSDGIAFAVTDAGALEFTDRFVVPANRADDAVAVALRLVADGSTLRAGRILAPLGIRYVVIPKTDGAASTVDDPIPLADGLLAAFQNQLDIGSIYGPPSLEIYVNQAWFPVGAQLSSAAADASRQAGEQTLARSDLSDAVPSMVGADEGEPAAANQVAPGVVHLAIPFDDRLHLTVDGVEVPARPGFGVTTAFDIEQSGTGILTYQRDANRGWWLASQMTLWIALLVLAAGARLPIGRRRLTSIHDETLIDLDDATSAVDVAGVAGVAPGGVAGEALASTGSDPDAGSDADDDVARAARGSGGSRRRPAGGRTWRYRRYR